VHPQDARVEGFWTLQHHDATFDLSMRRCMAAVRLHPVDGLDEPAPDKGTVGDIQGGMLWKITGGERGGMHSWWLTGTPVVSGGGVFELGAPGAGNWLPALSAGKADDRYEPKALQTPPWFQGSFLGGWTGSASSGAEEREQTEILHPDNWGIAAINAHPFPEAGTNVYDADAKGMVGRFQKLQSIFSIEDFGPGACGVAGRIISLQLGPSKQDGLSGFATYVEHIGGAGKGDRIHAIGAGKGGGPFISGGLGDQHTLGLTPEGNPIQPLHFPLWALFKGGPGDAPLAFTGSRWRNPLGDELGVWRRTHLRLNTEIGHAIPCGGGAGIWEWQTKDLFFVPKKKPWIPPPEDPKEPEEITIGGFGGIGPGGIIPGPDPRFPGGVVGPDTDGQVLQPGGSPFIPGETSSPAEPRTPLVGGPAEQDPRIPHTNYDVAFGGVKLKGFSTRPGEWDCLNDENPSPANQSRFAQAPIVCDFRGYGRGDGTWDGFSDTLLPNGWNVADGGPVVTPFGIPLRDILAGFYDPCAAAPRTHPAQTHVSIPGGLTTVDFSHPRIDNAGMSGAGVRLEQTCDGLSIGALDTNGAPTGVGLVINTSGEAAFTGTDVTLNGSTIVGGGSGFDPDDIVVHQTDAIPGESPKQFDVVVDCLTGNVVVF